MEENKHFEQIKAIVDDNRRKLLALFPRLTEQSGIYFLHREQDGIKYCYVGQAKHILTRLAKHLMGTQQHIDLSIRKHGLYSAENPFGWKIDFVYIPIAHLDEYEQKYIRHYASQGYQMRNKTIGGQGEGKRSIDCEALPKGYHDGLRQGYKNAQRFVRNLFEKNLTFSINGKPNKLKQKAYDKFTRFLEF